jgi:predicted HNH restriction endonuclease
MSQNDMYSEYISKENVDPLSKSAFKEILSKEQFCRAKGLVDACPNCHSYVEDKRPEAVKAEKDHKNLVSIIGAGTQIVEDYLPKGICIIYF